MASAPQGEGCGGDGDDDEGEDDDAEGEEEKAQEVAEEAAQLASAVAVTPQPDGEPDHAGDQPELEDPEEDPLAPVAGERGVEEDQAAPGEDAYRREDPDGFRDGHDEAEGSCDEEELGRPGDGEDPLPADEGGSRKGDDVDEEGDGHGY